MPTGNVCKIIITFVSFLQPNIFLIPCRILKKGANNDTILRIVLQKGIGLCQNPKHRQEKKILSIKGSANYADNIKCLSGL